MPRVRAQVEIPGSGKSHPSETRRDLQSDHIVELDSLRGVAAFFVLLLHFLGGWMEASPPQHLYYIFYIPLLTNGSGAVMLFFVLSGFVLTLSQMATPRQSYAAYAVRRICRIYLPYLAVLALSVLGCWKFHGLEMYGPRFHLVWRSAPTLSVVGQHLAFLGRYDVFAFNPVMWSLVHEMRISLIFPFLCLICLRLRAWTAVLFVLAFQVVGRTIQHHSGPYPTWGWPGVESILWSQTVGFCSLFLVGSLLARYRVQILSRLTKLSPLLLGGVFLAALVLYQYPAQMHVPRSLQDFVTGLGGAGFVMIALVPGGWLSRLLRLRPMRWLGKVSYSLYLVHSPILLLISILLYQKVNAGYVLAPYIAISLVAAAVFHRLVEVPSIRLGRVLGKKLNSVAAQPLEQVAAQ